MLNQYPLWKYLSLLGVLIIACIYALPNAFPDDPALQITGADASRTITETNVAQIEKALEAAQLSYRIDPLGEKRDKALLRFNSTTDQLAARDVVRQTLGFDFVVAQSLAPATPDWLANLGAKPMRLGLDLRGGIHFAMEVDMTTVMKTRFESYRSDIKRTLREEEDIRTTDFEIDQDSRQILMSFESEEDREEARRALVTPFRDFVFESVDRNGPQLRGTLSESKVTDIQDQVVTQNLMAIRNRIDALGVAEPIVQRQGATRIAIKLPGVQDPGIAKRIIGRTANLEFRLVDMRNDAFAAANGRVPASSELLYMSDGRSPVLLKKRIITKGDNVIDAQQSFDPETGRPQVNITLDSKGGRMMQRATSKNVGNSMAVVFIETKTEGNIYNADGEVLDDVKLREERSVINVATIQDVLGNNFRITGLDSDSEARELALLLRAGALAAPMYFVEERTIGPSLGKENIEAGFLSILVGFIAVLIFMLIYYRVFGLIANIALVSNLVLIFAVMSLFPGATLSLPGMAGIVLTVGMAVDANVLIFARIREELKNGASPQHAISAGYDRAYVTILDANITTLVVAIILLTMGSGPVKGFAVTLSIGIVTSMFTAIMGTRALVNLIYGGRPLKSLSV